MVSLTPRGMVVLVSAGMAYHYQLNVNIWGSHMLLAYGKRRCRYQMRSNHCVLLPRLPTQPVVVVYERKGSLYDEIALPRVEASILDKSAPACNDLQVGVQTNRGWCNFQCLMC